MKLIKKTIYFVLIILLFSHLIKNIINYQKSVNFYQAYKTDYEKEKRYNRYLKTEIIKKKSEKEVEKTIRNKLNLLKDGEATIILPSPSPNAPMSTPTIKNNWKRWQEVFFSF